MSDAEAEVGREAREAEAPVRLRMPERRQMADGGAMSGRSGRADAPGSRYVGNLKEMGDRRQSHSAMNITHDNFAVWSAILLAVVQAADARQHLQVTVESGPATH